MSTDCKTTHVLLTLVDSDVAAIHVKKTGVLYVVFTDIGVTLPDPIALNKQTNKKGTAMVAKVSRQSGVDNDP